MIRSNPCKTCGSIWHTAMHHKPRKAITQRGKQTLQYELWRDTVAKPYLDAKYGHRCAKCGQGDYGFHVLDVDHIQNRGSHPALKMALSNVQWLGREPCHREKTENLKDPNDKSDEANQT